MDKEMSVKDIIKHLEDTKMMSKKKVKINLENARRESFVEGQLKEKQKWINFVEAINVVCDYPKDFQKEIIKEVKKEKKELV